MSEPVSDPDQLSLLDAGNAPGAPHMVRQGCLCSPLLNAHGAGLRTTPSAEPVAVAWLVDPCCPRHYRA